VDESLPAGSDEFDCDGDGYIGSVEDYVYSYAEQTYGDQDACGEAGWPADLVSTGGSANRITLLDLTSFLFPSPSKLNTTPGDAGWDQRYDLVPNGTIALNDMTSILFGPASTPPMFAGASAFNGPDCPWSP
jgi:hypothetical protein